MSSPVLHQYLIECILDAVEQIDPVPRWSKLALTNKAFLHRARKSLYQVLRFSSRDNNNYTMKRLAAFPKVVTDGALFYIRSVELHLKADATLNEWVYSQEMTKVMSIIKSKTPKAFETCLLRGVSRFEDEQLPRTFETNGLFRQDFWNKFVAPYVQVLDLSDLYSMPSTLLACPSLRKLRMSFVTLDIPRGDEMFLPATASAKLKSLVCIESWAAVCSSLGRIIDVSDLEDLILEPDRQILELDDPIAYQEAVKQIVGECKGSLKTLSLFYDYFEESDRFIIHEIDLSEHVNLTLLSFMIPEGWEDGDENGNFQDPEWHNPLLQDVDKILKTIVSEDVARTLLIRLENEEVELTYHGISNFSSRLGETRKVSIESGQMETRKQ
ncbi:hypothetical protein NLJ89_g10264 [Agrocybe chaxingu]|uniref:Uncharacterized protein n=1 Tax=Agrocybe chaxingu TaxID=84603 RepID=A0A9W8JP71_9AGAR|nr:hypothetical protein NLJ89_g10264 [Agrocybe chaxingu]